MSAIRRLPRRLRAFPSAGLDEWSESRVTSRRGSSLAVRAARATALPPVRLLIA
jgi:hypothetical protein